MPEFLSTAWFAAVDRAVRQVPIPPGTATLPFVLEQVVADAGSEVRWRLVVDHEGARVERLPATSPDAEADLSTDGAAAGAPAGDRPTVRLRCDRAVARALADGTTSARAAFIAGELRLGGDTTALLAARPLLELVGAAVAGVTRADAERARGPVVDRPAAEGPDADRPAPDLR